MKFISAALLTLAVGYVSAQSPNAGVLFTSPLTGSVWTAGQNGIITWTVQDSSVTTISSIDLRQGPASALQLVQNIAQNVPATPSQYTWSIPASIPAGSDYAITMGASPNISYSGTISIQAGSGAAASGSASSNSSSVAQSSAPPTSSAASSSAASSAPATSAASSAASSSAASSAPAASSSAASSGAAAVKAGIAGAGLVAGAVALLL